MDEIGWDVTLGSTSPVGHLYDRYLQLYPEEDEAVTEWIMENRTNSYDPFGTSVANYARSSKEFNEARQVRRTIANERDLSQTVLIRRMENLKGKLVRIEKRLSRAVASDDTDAIEAATKDKLEVNEKMRRLDELSRSH